MRSFLTLGTGEAGLRNSFESIRCLGDSAVTLWLSSLLKLPSPIDTLESDLRHAVLSCRLTTDRIVLLISLSLRSCSVNVGSEVREPIGLGGSCFLTVGGVGAKSSFCSLASALDNFFSSFSFFFSFGAAPDDFDGIGVALALPCCFPLLPFPMVVEEAVLECAVRARCWPIRRWVVVNAAEQDLSERT